MLFREWYINIHNDTDNTYYVWIYIYLLVELLLIEPSIIFLFNSGMLTRYVWKEGWGCECESGWTATMFLLKQDDGCGPDWDAWVTEGPSEHAWER